MAWHDLFLLGPLGAMRELPSPPHGGQVAVGLNVKGGTWAPLQGPSLEYLWRVSRRWEFKWPEGMPADVDRLLRARYTLDRRPRRLLDPMTGANLLSVDASSTGSASSTLRAFDVGSRPVTFARVLDGPVEDATGVLRWAVPDGVADAIRADLLNPVPVLGRPVCVSLFVRGSGQVAAQVEPSGQASQRGAVATAGASWSRIWVTLPAGSASVSALPALAVSAGAARTIETAGWQVEHALTPSPYVLGGSCPRVRLATDGMAYDLLRLNRRAVTLELEEV